MRSATTPGDRIREERERRGWTQTELAREAGIPNARQSFVSALERNEQQHSKHFTAITRALGLNEKWVRTGLGPKYLDDGKVQQQQADRHITNDDEALLLAAYRAANEGQRAALVALARTIIPPEVSFGERSRRNAA